MHHRTKLLDFLIKELVNFTKFLAKYSAETRAKSSKDRSNSDKR